MTIAYGGILRCRVVGINMNYTMSISLLILKPLAADFDKMYTLSHNVAIHCDIFSELLGKAKSSYAYII